MSVLFNRGASIVLGVRGDTSSIGDRIEGLRILFNLTKDSSSNPHVGTIKIYNLSEMLWTYLQRDENIYVNLEIGYNNNRHILFQGDVSRKMTKREKNGSDIITTIDVKDGAMALETAKLDKSYEAGISPIQIMKDVAQEFKKTGFVMIKNVFNTLTSPHKTITGMAVSGSAKETMDREAAALDANWFINNNKLEVLPQGTSTQTEMIVLTPESGLLDYPIETPEGLHFKSLIITANMNPGQLVKIETDQINGTYIMNKLKFAGDTHGNNWDVEGECQPLSEVGV